MRGFKVFIQATRTDEKGVLREEMFSYAVETPDKDEAVSKARGLFDLECGLQGWEVASVGMLEL